MVEKLNLHASFAAGRTTISALKDDCRSSGIDACLILPTAGAAGVRVVNTAFMQLAAGSDFLFTAGTLHPFYGDNEEELLRLQEHGVRAIKLCSFSQGFSLSAPETYGLFKIIESANSLANGSTSVILDTFCLAHDYFGTPDRHTATPLLLGGVESRALISWRHIRQAPHPLPEEIVKHLVPSKNLYLDTSNAAHTLSETDFSPSARNPWSGPHSVQKEELNILVRLLDLAVRTKRKRCLPKYCRSSWHSLTGC